MMNEFHFSHPLLLILGAVPVLIGIFYFLFHSRYSSDKHLEQFIDPHLLPYLLVEKGITKDRSKRVFLAWTIVWVALTFALAGPRWNFREVETYAKGSNLVILLDLSTSMNATDLKPSRLIQAKQKIEDLLNAAKGVKFGIIAFAADPHLITPLTEDKETIRHFLPTLNTDLIHVQGSRLSPALEMASTILNSEQGNKAILVITDGGFEDSSVFPLARTLAEKGITIHTMGMGTFEGAPLIDTKGNQLKKQGTSIVSKLDKERLKTLSQMGHGSDLEARDSDRELDALLQTLTSDADVQQTQTKRKLWDEHFYLFAFPAIPLFLWWFRKGALFSLMILFFCLPSSNLKAEIADYFKNSEQKGKEAYDAAEYEKAIQAFQSPYRKGVSCYKAHRFAEAETFFRHSLNDRETVEASYNLGNTLVQQHKLQEAVTAYEKLLKKWPDNQKARENLALVKKMLEEQNQNENKEQQQPTPQDSANKKSSDEKDQQNKQESQPEKKQDNENQDNKKDNSNETHSNDESNNLDESQDHETDDESLEKKEKDGLGKDLPPKEQLETAKEMDHKKASKSQQDIDADCWLNQIENDPHAFMKNKFYIESKKNGTVQGVDPW